MANISPTQAKVFTATYISMAARRASLEGWSLLKPALQLTVGVSTASLGMIDTSYMFCYAVGEFINGGLCDRFAANRTVAVGLVGTALSLAAISVLSMLGFWSVYSCMLLWAVAGFSQSAVFPGCTKIMGQFFKRDVGRWMGIWTSNASIGNIVGALMVTLLMTVMAWESTMLAIGSLILVSSYLIWTFVQVPDSELTEILLKTKKMSILRALRIKGVVPYTLSYSCIKCVNYALMFWLPLYMSQMGVSPFGAGLVMILYEISGGFGSVIVGLITDRMRSRLVPLLILAVISAPTVLCVGFVGAEAHFYVCGIILGCAHISISNIISGVVSIELGKDNVGMMTGIIDGTASLVSGVGMLGIGLIQGFGWGYVWGSVAAVNLAAVVPLIVLRA